MKTDEHKICAYCKHFQEKFGFFDEVTRCTKHQKLTNPGSTCNDFTQNNNFYTDLNDEQGDTNGDSFESNFE